MAKNEGLFLFRDDLAVYEAALLDELRGEGKGAEVEDFGVERGVDGAICAVGAKFDTACRIAKGGEEGECEEFGHIFSV
jgi:hypothetical protein